MFARFAALALAAAAMGAADQPTPHQLDLDSFEQVWRTVRDKHFDPKLGGLDWQAVHDELRPRAEAATNSAESRLVMTEMLDRLKETHFDIIPADVYGEIDTGESKDGTTGIDLRVIDGSALVTEVAPDSSAARMGVQPGWEILRIDGQDVAPGIAKVAKQFAGSTLVDIIQTNRLLGRLEGEIGEVTPVVFREGAGREVPFNLNHAARRGQIARLGYLPPLRFWVEWRKLPSNVGYLRFNLFFEPETLIAAVQQAVESCAACAGFVIDLRGNPGGIGGLATGIAGWFVDRSGLQLGTMTLRSNSIHFAVFPRAAPFRGPLAVLVDGCSASTSEIFAGGMQDLKRARIFGTRTAGAALPSQFTRLPNGDGFQYAVANYVSTGGRQLEGSGVTPDEIVAPTREKLLAGHDAALDAALNWIGERKK